MYVAVPVQPFASVAVTVKVKLPCAVGVPESVPSEARSRPGGRLPVWVNVYGPVPPLAVIWVVGYSTPCAPLGNVVGLSVIVGHSTVTLKLHCTVSKNWGWTARSPSPSSIPASHSTRVVPSGKSWLKSAMIWLTKSGGPDVYTVVGPITQLRPSTMNWGCVCSATISCPPTPKATCAVVCPAGIGTVIAEAGGAGRGQVMLTSCAVAVAAPRPRASSVKPAACGNPLLRRATTPSPMRRTDLEAPAISHTRIYASILPTTVADGPRRKAQGQPRRYGPPHGRLPPGILKHIRL